jgi:hypothetical protein
MHFPTRRGWSGLAALHLLVALTLSGCAILKSYDQGITPVERLEECRLLDRKVTEAGQLNAVGTFLAGGAGLAAGVTDGNSEAYGILSGVFGLFAAWAAWSASRHNGRFDSRHCEVILNPDPQDTVFLNKLRELQNSPGALDSLRQYRDSLRQ